MKQKKKNISKFLLQSTPTYLMALWFNNNPNTYIMTTNSVRRLTNNPELWPCQLYCHWRFSLSWRHFRHYLHRNLSKWQLPLEFVKMTASGADNDANFIYQFHLTERKFHQYDVSVSVRLIHWVRVTHICVENLTTISSDNGLSPGRRQAIIWTNAGILLIGLSGINFNEIFIEILAFSFRKMLSKMLFGKWRPFCLGLNVLILYSMFFPYCLQGTDNPSHNLHKGVPYITCKST